MSQSRDAMIAELKRLVVPVLRQLGFKGAFPHFRRGGDAQIDLLTIQFLTAGGAFAVEVGKFPSQGYTLYGELIPASEVTMRHLLERLRLGAKDEHTDHWFGFELGNYAQVAELVIPFIRGQAVAWWAKP